MRGSLTPPLSVLYWNVQASLRDHFDVFDLTRRWRNRSTVLAHAFQMEFERLANRYLGLIRPPLRPPIVP